jgi:DNA-binding IclR family transcriptional regulator
MDSRAEGHDGGSIPTVLRTLHVLEELAQAGSPITPTEVNSRLGLPKATIHRLFATLEDEGFLIREIDGRAYSPGHRLRKLSVNVLSSLRVRTARLTVLTALAEDIGETCNIALPDRESMIYLERVETKWPLRIQLPVGTHVPFYCTAGGKMYLSSLSRGFLDRYINAARLTANTDQTITDRNALREEIARTAERGHGEDNEEFMDGMIAIAMPIRDDQQRLMATVSFHAPSVRLSLEQARSHIPRLREAADELSQLASA